MLGTLSGMILVNWDEGFLRSDLAEPPLFENYKALNPLIDHNHDILKKTSLNQFK